MTEEKGSGTGELIQLYILKTNGSHACSDGDTIKTPETNGRKLTRFPYEMYPVTILLLRI
jgi:hypothetical protein